jgi:hypothetical protein
MSQLRVTKAGFAASLRGAPEDPQNSRSRQKEKGPVLNEDRPAKTLRLEQELQAQLNVACIQRARSLTDLRIGDSVVGAAAVHRQQEIRAVEHVESLRLELQMKALGDGERFAEGHIGIPLARANEIVPAEVAAACQTRTRQDRQIGLSASCPAIGPAAPGKRRMLDGRIWTIVVAAVQIEVSARVDAVRSCATPREIGKHAGIRRPCG